MRKLMLLIALLPISICVFSQGTGYIKVANHGNIQKIEKVSTGGYITTGFDSISKMQVIRWDDNFNPVWKYKFTDANITPFYPKIIEANDGNFFLMTSSSEHTGSTFITKFSSTGSILWQKVYYVAAGALSSFAFSKAAGSDNGFLFGGGQCALSNNVVKCDASGNIEWQKQYYYPLSTGVITCWSIIPEGNGYVVSSGYNINSLLTFRLNATGAVTAHSAYTYTGMQILPTRIVRLNQTGGYAILGNYNNSNNNKTQFVAFYNSALALLSFNELTVTYTQFTLYDIIPVNNGSNVVVNGSMYENSAFTQVIINLSTSGTLVWKKRAAGNTGGINYVEFYGVSLKGNNTVHAGAGYNEGCVIAVIDSNGNGLCNDVTFNITNVHPSLTLQAQSITEVSANVISSPATYAYNTNVSGNKSTYCGSLAMPDENNPSANTISVFPNPANDDIRINGLDKWPVAVTIYSLTGQKILDAIIERDEDIPVRQLKPGYYFLSVRSFDSKDQQTLIPFIKE